MKQGKAAFRKVLREAGGGCPIPGRMVAAANPPISRFCRGPRPKGSLPGRMDPARRKGKATVRGIGAIRTGFRARASG